MAYRIWDESVLENKADFELTVSLDGVYNEKNPDGTDAVATVAVEGTSIGFAIAMLRKLAEEECIAVAEAVAAHNADDLGISLEGDDVSDADVERIMEQMDVINVPFTSFEIAAKGSMPYDPDAEVTITLTAPSQSIAIMAFESLTSNQKLSALATSFMPIDDEYEG